MTPIVDRFMDDLRSSGGGDHGSGSGEGQDPGWPVGGGDGDVEERTSSNEWNRWDRQRRILSYKPRTLALRFPEQGERTEVCTLCK